LSLAVRAAAGDGDSAAFEVVFAADAGAVGSGLFEGTTLRVVLCQGFMAKSVDGFDQLAGVIVFTAADPAVGSGGAELAAIGIVGEAANRFAGLNPVDQDAAARFGETAEGVMGGGTAAEELAGSVVAAAGGKKIGVPREEREEGEEEMKAAGQGLNSDLVGAGVGVDFNSG